MTHAQMRCHPETKSKVCPKKNNTPCVGAPLLSHLCTATNLQVTHVLAHFTLPTLQLCQRYTKLPFFISSSRNHTMACRLG